MRERLTGLSDALRSRRETERNGVLERVCDAMGNVAAYLDESGAEVASFTYSAFGETLIQSGSLRGSFPFRFSTKWHETDVTEFCDYGRRWYWPAYGRWISRDPIEEEGGENQYSFENFVVACIARP